MSAISVLVWPEGPKVSADTYTYRYSHTWQIVTGQRYSELTLTHQLMRVLFLVATTSKWI